MADKLERAKIGGIQEFYNSILWNSAENYFTPRNKFKISWTAIDAKRSDNLAFAEILNAFNLYADSIELPDLSIKNGEVIDDGRGTYYAQSDSIITPESNELTINYKDSEISIGELAFGIIQLNATPFFMPLRFNLKIDYFSDKDGKTIIMGYNAVGCRPLSVNSIKAEHDGKEINIRKVKFGFHNMSPDYKIMELGKKQLEAALKLQKENQPKTASEYWNAAGEKINQWKASSANSETNLE